jgi:poly(3-hydroxyoctanoate) depolymerase
MGRRIVYLPGMSGHGDFWAPVADALPDHESVLVDWPGLGTNPVDPGITGYDDLVDLVVAQLAGPSVLVAQSMGGYVAVRAAAQARDRVTHLVLAATSGGVDLGRFGAADWRPGSRSAHPDAPDWAFAPTADLTELIGSLDLPTLLVWATRDPISPLAVGTHLLGLFPTARLVAYDSDDHWVAREHAGEVAGEIDALLSPS